MNSLSTMKETHSLYYDLVQLAPWQLAEDGHSHSSGVVPVDITDKVT